MPKCKKYLQGYAEPETEQLVDFPVSAPYKHSVVIPAYDESGEFVRRFIDSDLSSSKVLLILVVNQPDSNTCVLKQENLVQQVHLAGSCVWQNNNLTLVHINDTAADIMLVDRFSISNTIPEKLGVGLARKIGADIATKMISKGLIESPWICSTDADTHLPDNYFTVLADIPDNTSAITYNFCHISHSDQLSEATSLYEQALRYYVCGLKWAGSSYAFHTIGSTLAFRYQYYSMVRGFPKRAAGEDFYLLNKLAKLAPVRNIATATVLIEPRLSNRVPFGTGPAVSKILKLSNIDDYNYYHPQLFIELKNCLSAMTLLWSNKDTIDVWFSGLSEPVQFALNKLHFTRLVKHIRGQILDEKQCNQHIFQWFDAFRTLKLIHIIQENFFHSIPLKQALKQAPFSVYNLKLE